MNVVAISRLTLTKPKWVIAHFVETSQAATEDVLKGCNRSKKTKKDIGKKGRSALVPSTRDDHTYANANASAKSQRDAFGATILPSNLSFDNMKKLSMNQIKVEDIPFIDDSTVTEFLIAENLGRAKETMTGKASSEKKKVGAEEEKHEEEQEQEEEEEGNEEDLDLSLILMGKGSKAKSLSDFAKTDPFEEIPGPRVLEGLKSTAIHMARYTTLYFLLRLLRYGWNSPLRKYGPLAKLPGIMGGKMLIVNRPEHILSIYEQDRCHPKSSSLDLLESSRIRRHGKIRKRAQPNESEWEDAKKEIDEVLLKEEEQYFDGLEEIGNSLVKRIRTVKNRENEVPPDFENDLNKWSLECLFQILFDKPFGFLEIENSKWPSKNVQLLKALRGATRNFHTCERGLQLWRLMNTSSSASLDNECQTIETIVSQYVYQAQMELMSKDDDPKSDPLTLTKGLLLVDGMTKTDVVTYLLDRLIVGMNTTTNALAFLLYHIARNRRAQNELFQEIKGLLPEKYSRLEYDHLCTMKYLHACLKESLRLKMPMPILMKSLNRDVILSNYQIPRGTLVLMAAQAEALREENFDGAFEFRPGRWLDPENKHLHMVLPLSGHSQCQNNFETRQAEISVMTCVAQIVRNFKVEFNYGRLNATSSTISYLTSPLKFSFIERED